ncbi:MAG: hypothetical protein EZS28_005487 [Streblomastix strix]|uniref:SPRY domain-containing protein n=1 Tax=Streblomastix strix TaxID=222440 RepID=A0A5J4WVH2_9EUKA|nr:MAG: hypothetical protein EZS28_005487 [Streblomastix strix]
MSVTFKYTQQMIDEALRVAQQAQRLADQAKQHADDLQKHADEAKAQYEHLLAGLTNQISIVSTQHFAQSPVISSNLDVQIDEIGIADESVIIKQNEKPSEVGFQKIVEFNHTGQICHIGKNVGGNSGFGNNSRVIMEVNMDSSPNSLTFFVNDVEQKNYIINIPPSVYHLPRLNSSFELLRFENQMEPSAKHGDGSRALEWGKEWKSK